MDQPMRRRTDEVCGACGSSVYRCDECGDFCPHERAADTCSHPYEPEKD